MFFLCHSQLQVNLHWLDRKTTSEDNWKDLKVIIVRTVLDIPRKQSCESFRFVQIKENWKNFHTKIKFNDGTGIVRLGFVDSSLQLKIDTFTTQAQSLAEEGNWYTSGSNWVNDMRAEKGLIIVFWWFWLSKVQFRARELARVTMNR